MTCNYRELLKRYMSHIHDCKSIFYLADAGYEPGYGANLTVAEWKELNSIAEEIESENDHDQQEETKT